MHLFHLVTSFTRSSSFKHAIFSLFIFINILSLVANPTSFSISNFYSDTQSLLFEGDATMIVGNAEFNHQFYPYHVGRCTYSKPFHLWDSKSRSLSDFTTNFTFMIDTNHNNDYGDGFAFFLAPFGYPIPPNSAGGCLGLFNTTNLYDTDKNSAVFVEFDTYPNSWDPNVPHIGINVNSIGSRATTGWDFNVTRSRTEICAQVTYNARNYLLSVNWTRFDASSDHFLSLKIDLRDYLPEKVVIGFSAATGNVTENLILCRWEFDSDLDFGKGSSREALFLIIGVTFVILIFVVTIYWIGVKKFVAKIKGRRRNVQVPFVSEHLETLAFPRRFSYEELVAATSSFAIDRKLGHGGSSQVFRGVLQDLGCSVAVKRIFADSELYEKVFINEVKIISRLIHKNLVTFIGWCHEQGQCLLVYAYMPNSSLDAHLYGPKTALKWDIRYKIALGLASALHYLHEDAEQCILHRDIKSANVLLDNDFNTKLGDFGIAKLLDPHLRSRTTGVAGTFGYMAPEYAFQGRASKESDMYSFGVVALEIACGRQTYKDGEYHVPLSEWVWRSYLEGTLVDVADERLGMEFDAEEMKCLLVVGLWCTHPNKKQRPKAGQVMKVLQLDVAFPKLACNRYYDHLHYNDLGPIL